MSTGAEPCRPTPGACSSGPREALTAWLKADVDYWLKADVDYDDLQHEGYTLQEAITEKARRTAHARALTEAALAAAPTSVPAAPAPAAAETVAKRMASLDNMFDSWRGMWDGRYSATAADREHWRHWLHGWLVGALQDAGVDAKLTSLPERSNESAPPAPAGPPCRGLPECVSRPLPEPCICDEIEAAVPAGPAAAGGETLLAMPEAHARYWLDAARKAKDQATAVLYAEQAINAWRNTAYVEARRAEGRRPDEGVGAETRAREMYEDWMSSRKCPRGCYSPCHLSMLCLQARVAAALTGGRRADE